jgi:hypothetical protein
MAAAADISYANHKRKRVLLTQLPANCAVNHENNANKSIPILGEPATPTTTTATTSMVTIVEVY